MNQTLGAQLLDIKARYAKDGFIIVGVAGSYARGEENESSDIDLVYTIQDPASFAAKNIGFAVFSRIKQIKDEIAATLGKKVDLIALNGLNEVGKKYIAVDMRYVE